MRRRIGAAAIAAFAVSFIVTTAQDVDAQVDDQSNGLWFVELDSSADTFRAAARDAGVDVAVPIWWRSLII
jgi:hypothetical protein